MKMDDKNFLIQDGWSKYTINLNCIDMALMSSCSFKRDQRATVPLWSLNPASHPEYVQFEIHAERIMSDHDDDVDQNEKTDVYRCHICDIDVPVFHIQDHVKSTKHKLFKTIADTAMERVRKQMIQLPPIQTRSSVNTYYCRSCSRSVSETKKMTHQNSIEHKTNTRNEKLLRLLTDLYKKNRNETETFKIHEEIKEFCYDVVSDCEEKDNDFVFVKTAEVKDKNDDGYDHISVRDDGNVITTNDLTMTNFKNVMKATHDNILRKHDVTTTRDENVMKTDEATVSSNRRVITTTETKTINDESQTMLEDIDQRHDDKNNGNKGLLIAKTEVPDDERITNEQTETERDVIIGSYCTICHLNLSAAQLKTHSWKDDHRYNLWLANKEKEFHWHISFFDNATVVCKICKITLPNSKDDEKRHLRSKEHKLAYKEVLKCNFVFKVDNKTIRCSACSRNILMIDEITHIMTAKHKKRLTKYKIAHPEHGNKQYNMREVDEIVTIKTKLPFLFEFINDPYSVRCTACDLNLKFSKKNIKLHSKEKDHVRLYQNILYSNTVVKVKSLYYCECCRIGYSKSTEKEHINSSDHVKNLQGLSRRLSTNTVKSLALIEYEKNRRERAKLKMKVADKSEIKDVVSECVDLSDHSDDDAVEFEASKTITFLKTEVLHEDGGEFITSINMIHPKSKVLLEEVAVEFKTPNDMTDRNTEALDSVDFETVNSMTNLETDSLEEGKCMPSYTKVFGKMNGAEDDSARIQGVVEINTESDTDTNATAVAAVNNFKESKIPSIGNASNDAVINKDTLANVERREGDTPSNETEVSNESGLDDYLSNVLHLIEGTHKSGEVTCKVCDCKVNAEPYLILEHTISVGHEMLYHSLLLQNNLKERNNGYHCESCFANVEYSQVLNHVNSSDHILKLSALPSKTDRQKKAEQTDIISRRNDRKQNFASNKLENWVLVATHKNYLMDKCGETELYCRICKSKFLNHDDIIARHVNTEGHMKHYEAFLLENSFIIADSKSFCVVCKVDVLDFAQLEHIFGNRHRLNVDFLQFDSSCDVSKNAQENQGLKSAKSSRKKDADLVNSVLCDVCNTPVPNNLKCIKMHENGQKHKKCLQNKEKAVLSSDNNSGAKPGTLKPEENRPLINVQKQTPVLGDHNKAGMKEALRNSIKEKQMPRPNKQPVCIQSLPKREDKKKDKPFFCYVCNVEVNRNPNFIFAHVESKSHKEKAAKYIDGHIESSRSNSLSIGDQGTSSSLRPDSDRAKTAATDTITNGFCNICRVRVPNSSADIKDHCNGKVHKNNALIIAKASKGFNCPTCTTYVSIKNFDDHCKGFRHKTIMARLKEMKESNCDKETASTVGGDSTRVSKPVVASTEFEATIPIASTSNDKTVANSSSNIKNHCNGKVHKNNALIFNANKEYNCTICNTYVPNCTTNINEHFKGSRHIANMAKLKESCDKETASNVGGDSTRASKPVVVSTEFEATIPIASTSKDKTIAPNTNSVNVATSDDTAYNMGNLCVTSNTNTRMICRLCNIKIDINDKPGIDSHLNGSVHARNLDKLVEAAKKIPLGRLPVATTANRNCVKTKDDEISTPIVLTAIQEPYTCHVCNVLIPNTKHNVNEHLRGQNHKANLTKLIASGNTSNAKNKTGNVDETKSKNENESNEETVHVNVPRNGDRSVVQTDTKTSNAGANSEGLNLPENLEAQFIEGKKGELREIDVTQYVHIGNDGIRYYVCQYCDLKIEINNPHNIESHLKGAKHRRNLNLKNSDAKLNQEGKAESSYGTQCSVSNDYINDDILSVNGDKKQPSNSTDICYIENVSSEHFDKSQTELNTDPIEMQKEHSEGSNRLKADNIENILTSSVEHGAKSQPETENGILRESEEQGDKLLSNTELDEKSQASIKGGDKIHSMTKENNDLQTNLEHKDVPQVNTERRDEPHTSMEHREPQTDTEQTEESQINTENRDEPQINTENRKEPQSNTEQAEEPQANTEQTEESQINNENRDETQINTVNRDEPQSNTEQAEEPQIKTENRDEPQSNTEQAEEPQIKTENRDEPQTNPDHRDEPQTNTEHDDQSESDKEHSENLLPNNENDTKPPLNEDICDTPTNTTGLKVSGFYVCNVCNFVVANNPVDIKQHLMGARHGTNLQAMKEKQATEMNEELYHCDVCNVEISKSSILIKEHISLPSHIRQFECMLLENRIAMKNSVCYCKVCDLYFNKFTVPVHVARESHRMKLLLEKEENC